MAVYDLHRFTVDDFQRMGEVGIFDEDDARPEGVDRSTPSFRYSVNMRKKTTVYLDEDLLRAAKVMAARTGVKDYEVFEAALKAFLGFGILERARARGGLGEEEGLALAYRELRKQRSGK